MATKKDMTRTERLEVRLEPEEKEAFQRAAAFSGVGLSSWIRERLRQAARRELKGAGETAPFMVKK